MAATADDACDVATAKLVEREASPWLLFLICLISLIEGADMALLPSVFAALQVDLGLSLVDLAQMSLFQSVFQCAAAPFWGVLADRGTVERKTLIAGGAVLQGAVTCVLAGVESLPVIILLRSLNGVFLATLRPVVAGMLADVTSESRRGKVFGFPMMAVSIGQVLGNLIGTPLSMQTVDGVQGWRVAFLLIGGASIVIGLAVALLMTEPEREHSLGTGKQDSWVEVRRLVSFFRLPTFGVLVVQGIFASVTGNALSYRTLFFQIAGITDIGASILNASGLVSCAFGAVIGGYLSDSLVRRCFPLHGRPLLAQVAVIMSLPNFAASFLVQTSEEWAFCFYLSLSVLGGLTAWSITAVNMPILSEIVPANSRSAIMAWQTALEGAAGAVLGNAMVSLIAEKIYGYDMSKASAGHIHNAANWEALGSSLAFSSCVPLFVCFGFYTLLHCTYPRDLKLARALAVEANPDDQMSESKANPDDQISESITVVV